MELLTWLGPGADRIPRIGTRAATGTRTKRVFAAEPGYWLLTHSIYACEMAGCERRYGLLGGSRTLRLNGKRNLWVTDANSRTILVGRVIRVAREPV